MVIDVIQPTHIISMIVQFVVINHMHSSTLQNVMYVIQPFQYLILVIPHVLISVVVVLLLHHGKAAVTLPVHITKITSVANIIFVTRLLIHWFTTRMIHHVVMCVMSVTLTITHLHQNVVLE